MPQKTEFPYRFETGEQQPGGQVGYMEIEPGDVTRYRFLVMKSFRSHDFCHHDLPAYAVASVDGPLLPGIWIPLPYAKLWWDDTKDRSDDQSLDHHVIIYVMGESGGRLTQQTVNPWTARAALLAVLKAEGVI